MGESHVNILILASVAPGIASPHSAAVAGDDLASLPGTVRFATSELMGIVVLPRTLAGIRHTHSEITFELVLNNRNDDILRREADIALRMARHIRDDLTPRKIKMTTLGFYPFCSYLDRFGTQTNMEELLRAHLIGLHRDDLSAVGHPKGNANQARYTCD